MSQQAFLQAFDASAFGSFAATGLGDTASYLAPLGVTPVACTVLVDRNVRDYGDDLGPVATLHTLVAFQLAELTPEKGGEVTVEGEAFTLVAEVRRDESMSRWVVERA